MHRIEGVGIRRDPLVAIFLEDPPLFRFWISPEYLRNTTDVDELYGGLLNGEEKVHVW